jgi:hypothetical protein
MQEIFPIMELSKRAFIKFALGGVPVAEESTPDAVKCPKGYGTSSKLGEMVPDKLPGPSPIAI